MRTAIRTSLLCLVGLLLTASGAEAQSVLKRARKAAERGAERAVEREAERRADRAVTGAIECVLGDRACAEKAQAEGQEVVYVDAAGNPVASEPTASAAPGGAAAQRPGEGVWANYDFVPGERPLFVSDFSADRVGDFPRRLEFAEGNMEVVEWQGQRFLRATAGSAFYVALPETLPERFTIEYDVYNPAHDWIAVYTAQIEDGPMHYNSHPGSYFLVTSNEAGIDGDGPEAKTRTSALIEGLVPVRIMVDGTYAKMYLGEQRVANVPNANIVRGDKLHFILYQPSPEQPTYIGNLRVMAGGRALYDALAAEGRVATQGILFDTGSARLRPESTPTLEEITDMLKQHADLKLTIEGHTDNVGQAAANQALSEQRAAAVVAYLTQQGIDASRLEAKGLGDTKPVASNDTPEGRQQNRRVVLVRL